MSQGDDELFGGRLPSRCLGLTWTSRPKDIRLLDTKYGIVNWQACPEEVLAIASPALEGRRSATTTKKRRKRQKEEEEMLVTPRAAQTRMPTRIRRLMTSWTGGLAAP